MTQARSYHVIVLLIVNLAVSAPSGASDTSVSGIASSLVYGASSKVRMARIAAQSHWERRWLVRESTHLTGYWDISLAQWRASAHQNVAGRRQGISIIGVTPVFRYQSKNAIGWYLEGGIGIHLLSQLYDNDGNNLSTRAQFGDHIGAGYVYANNWALGLKLQRFSNGGVKKPTAVPALLS